MPSVPKYFRIIPLVPFWNSWPAGANPGGGRYWSHTTPKRFKISKRWLQTRSVAGHRSSAPTAGGVKEIGAKRRFG
jgi:hypothetical protein